MMIKYRVTDVAKDLQIPNKAVIEAIEKYCGETKKAMTALNEQELDVVLETFTQGHQVKSLDAFFADNGQEEEPVQEPAAAAEPVQEEKKEEKAQKAPKPAGNSGRDRRTQKNAAPAGGQNTSTARRDDRRQAPRAQQQKPAAKPQNPPQGSVSVKENEEGSRPSTRLVDTRSSQVDVERYNEKYDRLASEKIRTDNTVQKQKLNQRSQRRGKPKNSRKETEAERLRLIAMERKAKP